MTCHIPQSYFLDVVSCFPVPAASRIQHHFLLCYIHCLGLTSLQYVTTIIHKINENMHAQIQILNLCRQRSWRTPRSTHLHALFLDVKYRHFCIDVTLEYSSCMCINSYLFKIHPPFKLLQTSESMSMSVCMCGHTHNIPCYIVNKETPLKRNSTWQYRRTRTHKQNSGHTSIQQYFVRA